MTTFKLQFIFGYNLVILINLIELIYLDALQTLILYDLLADMVARILLLMINTNVKMQ